MSVTVRLSGGLGNQMFQYATGYSLSRFLGEKLSLHVNPYGKSSLRETRRLFSLSEFGIIYDELNSDFITHVLLHRSRMLSRLFGYYLISEDQMNSSAEGLLPEFFKDIYLNGYWQHIINFHNVRNDLFGIFRPTHSEALEATDLYKKLKEPNSFALHIRRGDLVTNQAAHAHHGLLPLSYYQEAIRLALTLQTAAQFYLFTDDPEWCRHQFDGQNQLEIVSGQGLSDIEEFHLFASARNAILANSTYSWWAAYLGDIRHGRCNRVVLAPRMWNENFGIEDHSDFSHWIRL
jgi:hypothetical protein